MTAALLTASCLILTAASLIASELPAKHSKEFGLRYECDVAPAVAGWSLASGGSEPAPLAANGWIRLITNAPESLAFEHSQWRLSANHACTIELRYRSPRQGQMTLLVSDGDAGREVLVLETSGLYWCVNSLPQLVSPHQTDMMYTVRFAAWRDAGHRMVQVWHDGSSVYGPAPGTMSPIPVTAITAFGEFSPTEECDIEIDYVRMEIGAALAPFQPALDISGSTGTVALTWSTAPKVAYKVQSSANLLDWFDHGPAIPSLSAFTTVTDNIAGRPVRFYRVREDNAGSIDLAWSPGPPPVCTNLPPLTCTAGAAGCAELVPFEPALGPGYENYPINGETAENQYRSFVRREVRQAIQHAAAKVECMAGHWPFGNNRPLGLGDMSEANGAIPGTSEGAPAHPVGTHENGTDIDVAYYQLDSPDNRLRAICDSTEGGTDQNHCTAPPVTLDVWRTAFFVGILAQHPGLRIIGVDGAAGPLLVESVQRLAVAGWLPADSPALVQQKLAFETSDTGLGWYHFHHRHMHVSFTR